MRYKLLGISIALAATSLGYAAKAPAQEHSGREHSVECTSRGYARQRCDVSWRDARLERQLSNTACVRDETWGIDRDGLWVDGGCSGRFVAIRGDEHDRADYGSRGDDERRDNERRGDDRRDGDRDDDHRRGEWQPDENWNQRFSVTCESQGGRYRFCQVDLGGGGRAELQRQLSSDSCVEGDSWGSNRAGVWVSQGCRGEFLVERRWR